MALLRHLQGEGYRFTAVTPASHERILARPWDNKPGLRDIFGWNRPFAAADLDQALLDLLVKADGLVQREGGLRSKFRVASLGDDLFLHSAFPTEAGDAVFFGPDTYRFASFIADEIASLRRPGRIVDMGAGSGAGGAVCARLVPEADVSLIDVNPTALRFARINAAAAQLDLRIAQGSAVPSGADLVVANPPYMIDPLHRAYRDGGDLFGGAIALDWVRESLAALAPGGAMLLYTGAAFVDGCAPALDAIREECQRRGARYSCREIDPDVFGEELAKPGYEQVERIAAVGCVIGLG